MSIDKINKKIDVFIESTAEIKYKKIKTQIPPYNYITITSHMGDNSYKHRDTNRPNNIFFFLYDFVTFDFHSISFWGLLQLALGCRYLSCLRLKTTCKCFSIYMFRMAVSWTSYHICTDNIRLDI